MSENNVFHGKHSDVQIDLVNNQLSISDKLDDTDQQIQLGYNFDQSQLRQTTLSDNSSTPQQQSSTVQQASKASTRKKKSKSKSFQSSQQFNDNPNYRTEVVLKFQQFILDDAKMAENFEKAIFNKSQIYSHEKKKPTGEHDYIFKNGVYQPFFQKYFEVIDTNNYKYNDSLFQQILNNQLMIWDYVDLDDDKLRPQIWQKIIDKKHTEISKIENDRNFVQPTSIWHRCGQCGNSKTSVSKKQTRSADEGETVFIFCQTCSNSWVQY